jgi:hypothetical protein
MSDKTPIERAKITLSGKGLRARVTAAENKVRGIKPKVKAKPKAKTKANLIRPKKKFVDLRQAKIDAAREADRMAIAERRARNGLRRGK